MERVDVGGSGADLTLVYATGTNKKGRSMSFYKHIWKKYVDRK